MSDPFPLMRRCVCDLCGTVFFRSGRGGWRYCSDACRERAAALSDPDGLKEAKALRELIKAARAKDRARERALRLRRQAEEARLAAARRRCTGCAYWRRATEAGYFCHYILDTGESCRKYRSADGRRCSARREARE